MSTQAYEDFRTHLAEDENLQEEMQGALGTSVVADVPPEALVSFAAAHGFALTVEDVEAAHGELGAEELGGVSGGAVFVDLPVIEERTEEEQKKIDEQWKKVMTKPTTYLPGGGSTSS